MDSMAQNTRRLTSRVRFPSLENGSLRERVLLCLKELRPGRKASSVPQEISKSRQESNSRSRQNLYYCGLINTKKHETVSEVKELDLYQVSDPKGSEEETAAHDISPNNACRPVLQAPSLSLPLSESRPGSPVERWDERHNVPDSTQFSQPTFHELSGSTSLTTFHPFPVLPPELRALIWSLYIHSVPTTTLGCHKNTYLMAQDEIAAYCATPPGQRSSAVRIITGQYPAIMHVCSEARKMGERFYSWVGGHAGFECWVGWWQEVERGVVVEKERRGREMAKEKEAEIHAKRKVEKEATEELAAEEEEEEEEETVPRYSPNDRLREKARKRELMRQNRKENAVEETMARLAGTIALDNRSNGLDDLRSLG